MLYWLKVEVNEVRFRVNRVNRIKVKKVRAGVRSRVGVRVRVKG